MPGASAAYHSELMWTGSGPLIGDVSVKVDAGRIVSLEPNSRPSPREIRLPGITLPGLANAHSHAFHRALRGRTHSGRGDFWAWRQLMYEVAGRLDPDSYFALGRAVYAEMALAGVTTVGEFHYLHHDPSGRPYSDPNAMGRALVAGAASAGIKITLIDTCYLHGGFGRPLEGVQKRFGDADVDAWAHRADDFDGGSGPARRAAAIHSVRAVDERSMAAVTEWSAERKMPLHFHVSEQPAENAACREATGGTPVQLLDACGALGPRSTAVHATHVDGGDIALLGASGTTVCLCPTTERDLADGVGPAGELRAAGCPLSFGSDSHAVIEPFEEMRATELDQRLVTGRRGHHEAEGLLHAATAGGMRSIGWDGGTLEPGAPADLIAVGLRSVRMAGSDRSRLVDHVVFSGAACDVTDVVVDGRRIVEEGRHVVEDVPAALDAAIVPLAGAPVGRNA